MKHTHILWDFNGTLLDDVQVSIDCANALLVRRGKPTIPSREAYRSVFTFPLVNYYRKIGLCTDEADFPAPAEEWIREYLARIPSAGVYDGVHETLQKIKDLGLKQSVFSATEYKMLCGQIKSLSLERYFDEILGTGDVYAHGKTEIGTTWSRNHPDAHVILFGDSDHDAKVAKAMGIDCVLIASGHQTKPFLQTCGVPVVDDISDVFQFL